MPPPSNDAKIDRVHRGSGQVFGREIDDSDLFGDTELHGWVFECILRREEGDGARNEQS